jgi:hypothetical protein
MLLSKLEIALKSILCFKRYVARSGKYIILQIKKPFLNGSEGSKTGLQKTCPTLQHWRKYRKHMGDLLNIK